MESHDKRQPIYNNNLQIKFEETVEEAATTVIDAYNNNIGDLRIANNIKDEFIEKYRKHKNKLDRKFLKEITTSDFKKINSCLWEMILVDHFSNFSDDIVHKENGPDWEVRINGKNYFIEATCAQLPNGNSPTINKTLDAHASQESIVNGPKLIEEVKLRISNAIRSKIKKHAKFIKEKKSGYILCVSYNNLSMCDLYHAVATVLPIGPIQLGINVQNERIENIFLIENYYLRKTDTTNLIETNILGNENYKWISAILFSKVPLIYLFDNAFQIPWISWGDIKNDFVMVYNPVTEYPLTEKLFDTATTITVRDQKIRNEGKIIFPLMAEG